MTNINEIVVGVLSLVFSAGGEDFIPPKTVLAGHDGSVMSIAFSPSGKLIVTALFWA